ncbi:Ger(x)C family spore germination protein [Ammoniphilus sp. 3BR4]|uniref:Ger(x)C family spore germination protein n=1 Tax=Ammoniphilus sp. 3BR4 TaxID=3158265 RepID=UPI003464EC19
MTHLKEQKIPLPSTGIIRVTVQIGVPGRIPLGPGEGGGGGGGQQKPVWVLSVVGDTVNDAIMNLQQQVAYRLFFGHLRGIVISEAIAKKGVQNLNDYLRRNPEVRRTAWMMVSKGNAAKAMLTSPQLERVPTLYLTATMDQAVKLGKLPNDFLGNFWSASSAKEREPYLPYVEVRQNNIFIEGIAYFKVDKMVGVTLPLEIGIFMELTGVEQGGYSVLIPVSGTSGTVMMEVINRKTKIRVDIKDGRPYVTANVNIEGNLVEKSNEQFELNKPEMILKIEAELAKTINKGQEVLIQKTQQQGSDIFGFGEYIRAKHPQYWNQRIKTKSKWQEMYKEISIDTNVTLMIRRVGMKAR